MKENNTESARISPNYKWLWIVFLGLVISGCISRLYFGVFVRDQAELVVLSQQFTLIYDEQIPVLTWLMTGLFRATDYFILWPDIYKFICLGLCLLSVFKLTFHITKDSSLALVAALSLFFLPTFHEDMLGEVTHTAALLAATALSTDWMVRQKPSQVVKTQTLLILMTFWLFGFLAKHTMSFVIIAQVLAYLVAFNLPKSAKFRLIFAAVITFILITPVYILLASQAATLGQGFEEFHRDEGFARGLVDLLSSSLTEALIFILFGLIGCLFFKLHKKVGKNIIQTAEALFLALTLLFIVLLFVPFIILADIAVVRDRWLAPALMLLGPLFAILISGAKTQRIQQLRTALIGLVCVLGLFRAGEPLIDRLSGTQNIDNAPLALMSQKLREHNPDITTYISSNYNLLATLKYQDPSLHIYSQKNLRLFQPDEYTSRQFILLSMQYDPDLKTPHLNFKCPPKRVETLRGWTYFYEICTF